MAGQDPRRGSRRTPRQAPASRGAPPTRRPGPDRLRYLPVSVGLGLLVGDLLTLALRGDLTLARAGASAAVAAVAWLALDWAVTRRGAR